MPTEGIAEVTNMNTPGVHFARDSDQYSKLLDRVAASQIAAENWELKARRNRRYGNFATVVAVVLLVAALAGWLR